MTIKINKERKFFNSLQVFRGVAALMVVFHHEWIAFSHFHNVHSSVIEFIAGLGKYGVDFFFVLSGFIITYSNYGKAGSFSESSPYLLNRVLRIYLPYLPVSFLLLALYYFFPSTSEGSDRDISLMASLTLIPAGKPALSVAWTLVHEMMFYIFFISWFFSKKAWYIWLIIWSLLIIYLNYFSFSQAWRGHAFLNYIGSFYNLEFILGFLTAIGLRKWSSLPKKLFLSSGIFFLIIIVAVRWLFLSETKLNSGINLALALGFGCIIIGSIGTRLDDLRSGNFLMVSGNASYSIYLVHNLCISVFMRLFMKFQEWMPKIVIFISIFFICCLAGVLYSKLFEEYLLKKFKSKLQPTKVKQNTQLAQAAD